MDDLRSILPSVDFFLPNYDEASHLTGEQDPERQAACLQRGRRRNRGHHHGRQRGCFVRTATDTRQVAAPSVDVVDGSGAGDAFAAGLIVGILEGWPLERSLRFASEVGALACTALGCSAGIPDRQQVLRQMSTH